MKTKSAMSYVTTTSGPVVPAKNKPIETMDNIIAAMQSKYKKGEKGVVWQDLAEKFNSRVKPNYVTIRDIVKKAVNEAVSTSHGRSVFRMDLGNIVMDGAHAKFVITRNDKKVFTELLYPNDNGNITLRFNVDNLAMKMYEISLDSEYYLNDFGNTIKMCCDDCIKEIEGMNEEEDLFGSSDEFAPMMSSDMRTLNDMCALVESEFGADDFASDTEMDDSSSMDIPDAPADAGLPSDSMDAGMDDVGDGDTFRNYAGGTFRTTKGDNPEFDCMNRIISCKEAIEDNVSSSPVRQTESEKYNGSRGNKDIPSFDTLNKFLKFYPTLDNVVIPNDVLEAIGNWLAENTSMQNTAAEFEEWARMSPTISKYVLSDASNDSTPNEYPEPLSNLETPSTDDVSDEQSTDSYLDDGSMDALMSDSESFSSPDEGMSDEFAEASGVDSIAEDTDSELNL